MPTASIYLGAVVRSYLLRFSFLRRWWFYYSFYARDYAEAYMSPLRRLFVDNCLSLLRPVCFCFFALLQFLSVWTRNEAWWLFVICCFWLFWDIAFR